MSTACRTFDLAAALASRLGIGVVASLDVADTASLDAAVAAHDTVVYLAPAAHRGPPPVPTTP